MKTGLFYDCRQLNHINLFDRNHPENANRVKKTFEALLRHSLAGQCTRIYPDTSLNLKDCLVRVHSKSHIADMEATDDMDLAGLKDTTEEHTMDVYFCGETYQCALLSVQGVITISRAVFTNEITNGIAIVRPPGHHAECTHAMGFCVFNNVSVATRFLQSEHDCKKILVVDWDIHHGNGTQNEFYSESEVLYLSIHRFEDAGFYPFFPSAGKEFVGLDAGMGFNVNVPWPCGGMGDADYLYVFEKIVIPIAKEYNPEMIIVSAGFDAALGDELGECNVTPNGFAEMTRQLMEVNDGKIALALEGGYCIPALEESITACTRILLGQTVEKPDISNGPHMECKITVDSVIKELTPYWKCFAGHVSATEEGHQSQYDEPDSQDGRIEDVYETAGHNLRTGDLRLLQISGPRNENPIYHSLDYHKHTGSLWVIVHDVSAREAEERGCIEELMWRIHAENQKVVEVYLKNDLGGVGQMYDKLLRYSKASQLNVVLTGVHVKTVSSLIETIFQAKWWKDMRVHLAVIATAQIVQLLDKGQTAWWKTNCRMWIGSDLPLNCPIPDLTDSHLGTLSSGQSAGNVSGSIRKLANSVFEHFSKIEGRRVGSV